MKRDWSQFTVMFSGTLLIISGMLLTVFQVINPPVYYSTVPDSSSLEKGMQSITATTKGFVATTHYVGLELVIVGAVLQIACVVHSSIKRKEN